VIDDVVGTWISLNHMDGVLGHKRNGLSIALDDTEDRFVTRAAKKIWDDVDMSKLRDDAVSEVRSQFLEGRLTWTRECVDGLRVAFPDNDAGCHIEGQEMDGELEAMKRRLSGGASQVSLPAADLSAADQAAVQQVKVTEVDGELEALKRSIEQG
jgi:hypothetical protein